MKNIVYTTNRGFPSNNIGGSNKIIYLLLKNINYDAYNPYYLSTSHFRKFESKNDLEYRPIIINSNFSKKILLKTDIINRIISAYTYQKFYYFKKNRSFNNNLMSICNKLIHCHNPVALNLTVDATSKKILTIHNKGSIINDIYSGISNCSKGAFNYYRNLEIQAIKKADIITFPSKVAKEVYFQDIGIEYAERKDIRIIYNGIDHQQIKNTTGYSRSELTLQIRSDFSKSINLINVADHVKLKNIDKLILAIKDLVSIKKINIKLINIGSGPLTFNLQQMINENNLEDYIFLLGRVENTKVIKLLKAGDALVMPSGKVVFDLVNLEALASGLPLLLSKNGGNLEIMDEGKNGFYIEENTPKSIIQAIIKLINSNLKRGNIDMSKCVDVLAMVEQYENLYQELDF